MSLFEIGRLVVKIAGRDAGKTGIVIDTLKENYVLVDGQTRRKKVNVKHLEPLPQVLKIKKGASSEEVKAEFKKIGLETVTTKPKERTNKPKKQRKEKLVTKKEQKKKTQEETKKKPKKEKKTSSFEEAVEKESKEEGV